jgi:ADP-heptose:LPS heptosyltransferase
VSRIAILRALPGLGDLLCAVPALRALRAHDVTYIGLPQLRPVAKRYLGYVDRYVDFPGWPGIPEVELDPARSAAFIADMQAERFDLALQLHGSGTASAGFVRMLGAGRTGGFHAPATPSPGEGWLGWVEQESEVLRLLRLLEHLGFAPDGAGLEFPVDPADERAAAELGLPEPYAVLHPGSSLPDRRWPAERFAAAADALYERGLAPVVTGTPAEADAVDAVLHAARLPVVSLLGRTTVGSMAAVLRGAAVVVTNDTGTSHLAAAVQAPSVVVHTVTDPARWAPIDAELHRPLRGDVEVRTVLREVDDLLSERRAGAARSSDSGS